MKTTVYLIDWLDESMPASTLEGWAAWLHANDPDDGPCRVIEPGTSFAVSVNDITYHECRWRDDNLVLPDGIDWARATVAFAHGDGMGWFPEDIVASPDEAREYAQNEIATEGETFCLAVMVARKGGFTATYDLVDGTPVLQPDGWAL